MWGTGAFQRPWTEALGLGGIVKQSRLAMGGPAPPPGKGVGGSLDLRHAMSSGFFHLSPVLDFFFLNPRGQNKPRMLVFQVPTT